MLEVINLKKTYEDGTEALRGVSFTVTPGEIFVLLGANGAGKTTLIMTSLGFTEPTAGSVKICDIDITREPLKAKKHAAYVSENVMLYNNFTARQNLEFFSGLAGKNHTERDYQEVIKRVGLAESDLSRRLANFSKGMRQRLGIAIAILKDARVIFLDEPTSGLDPKGGVEFLELLRTLREEQRTILMTTHDIFRAKIIASRIGIMNKGRLLQIIEKEEIPRVDLEKLYLDYVETDEASVEMVTK
jgi:ABC-2 type transport system ATP-binding protein